MQWVGQVGSHVRRCWWNPTFQSSDRVIVRVSSGGLYLSVLAFFVDVAALGVFTVELHQLGRRKYGSWRIHMVRKGLLLLPALSWGGGVVRFIQNRERRLGAVHLDVTTVARNWNDGRTGLDEDRS